MKAANRQEAALADAVRESITLMTGRPPRRSPSIWPMVLLWLFGMGAVLLGALALTAQAAHALAGGV